MWMVAGLGNPGQEYTDTRHNVGFRVLERLSDRIGARLSDKKFKARLGKGRIGSDDALLIAPQTYMNLSGEAVGPALGFYKLRTDRLVVVHDELDLAFGAVEVKVGGGHRGHNGLRSLHKHLPDDRYVRVRVGIGRPPPQWDPADYVLGKFAKDERDRVDAIIDQAVEAIEDIVARGPADLASAKGSRRAGRTGEKDEDRRGAGGRKARTGGR